MPARPCIAALGAALALAAPAVLAQDPPAQTLPRTGFDVVPLAAAGAALLLAGVARWRRPHARR